MFWKLLKHQVSVFCLSDIIQLLLDYGANVNDAGGEHCRGVTPLHDAAQNGHVEAVQILISRGADPNLKDEKVCLKTVFFRLLKSCEKFNQISGLNQR